MSTHSPSDPIHQKVKLLSWIVGVQSVILLLLCWLVSALLWGERVEVDGLTSSATPVQSTEYEDYEDEMRAFFERMTTTLDGQVRRAGDVPTKWVPSDEEIDDAVETRTMHSDESKRVLQKLRRGFDKFDLDWTAAMPEQ